MNSHETNIILSSQHQGVLYSLPRFDQLRFNNTTQWTRQKSSNLDVLQITNDYENPIAICHLHQLGAMTQGDKPMSQSTFEEVAAVALAAHHLNVGDGSLIPEVGDLHNSCPIRFTVSLMDTQANTGVALSHVADVTTELSPSEMSQHGQPCAFIGATYSRVSVASSMLTGRRGYPQVSPSSTSADLDDKDQHPLFARTIPSDHANAIPVVLFFRDVLKLQHLAIININDTYGSSFVQGMLLAAKKEAPDMQIQSFAIANNPTSINEAILGAKATQYTYFWCVVYEIQTHDLIMKMATSAGIAGTGIHNWFFSDSFAGLLRSREYGADSDEAKAYHGVGLIEATAGMPGEAGFDLFLDKLVELDNPADLSYLKSIFTFVDDPGYYDYVFDNFGDFVNSNNPVWAVFAYEAAIALGLAACDIMMDQAGLNGDDRFFLSGPRHYDRMTKSQYSGVAGDIVFNQDNGSRNYSSVLYKVTNFQSIPGKEEGNVAFQEVITHISRDGEWTKREEFIFNDGTSAVQPDIPPVAIKTNVVTHGVRITALTFCSAIIALALGLMYWTERNKKSRVVLASQPFFLHTICIGVLILGSAIVAISVDHEAVGMHGSTIACNAMIWLEVIGIGTTVSAFMAKTHRINRILNNAQRFQRIKVTVRQVLTPIVITLSASILVLSLMSSLGPPEYKIIVERRDKFGRETEVRGECYLTASIYYLIALAVIDAGVFAFAFAEAWKARNLSTEFAESHFIFRAMMAIIAVLFVGLPLLFLARDNPSAIVFVGSAIIFVASVSILLLTFLPKMKYARSLGSSRKSSQRWHITGLDASKASLNLNRAGSKATPSKRTRDVSRTKLLRTASETNLELANATDGDLGKESEATEDNLENLTGIRILTTKTVSELAVENEALTMENESLARENEVFQETLSEVQRLIDTTDDITVVRKHLSCSQDI
ncbi:hypothetical protein ACA910_003883 [Epithemia clementina (nom. ined.)]